VTSAEKCQQREGWSRDSQFTCNKQDRSCTGIGVDLFVVERQITEQLEEKSHLIL
jgi:hypothetical protein